MEKQRIKLNIAEYAMSPGPRYSSQGDDSGEDFYHLLLNSKFYEAFSTDTILEVNFDGPDGYASSFLDEAFGNLVYDFELKNVQQYVVIVSNEEPEWIDMLENETYVEWEERRIKNQVPKKTKQHESWYRLVDNKPTSGVWISY